MLCYSGLAPTGIHALGADVWRADKPPAEQWLLVLGSWAPPERFWARTWATVESTASSDPGASGLWRFGVFPGGNLEEWRLDLQSVRQHMVQAERHIASACSVCSRGNCDRLLHVRSLAEGVAFGWNFGRWLTMVRPMQAVLTVMVIMVQPCAASYCESHGYWLPHVAHDR